VLAVLTVLTVLTVLSVLTVLTVLMAQTVLMGPTVPTPRNALPLTPPLTSPLIAAITSRCLALAIPVSHGNSPGPTTAALAKVRVKFLLTMQTHSAPLW